MYVSLSFMLEAFLKCLVVPGCPGVIRSIRELIGSCTCVGGALTEQSTLWSSE
jgi:hypothetical protein